MMNKLLLVWALGLAGPALAQQAPSAASALHGQHGPPAAPGTFRATVLHVAPLLGTERRTYRLYAIELGPGTETARHMHPGGEIAHVTEGSVVLGVQGEDT